MPDITEIDVNFKSESKLDLDDVCFYSVKENAWCLFGLISDDLFRRMPKQVANKVNEGAKELHTNTSGGRVRFSTNSPYVAISTKMPDKTTFSHMPNTGVSGFDMCVNNEFIKTFIPPCDLDGGYEGVYHFDSSEQRDILIHFPLYNNVKELYIGLKKGCSFEEHSPYSHPGKIVYYGSSITQGGCVSRPGMAYPAQISAELDIDFINLGFSASAKGEVIIAEYIAGLNPDIFVIDYDHNAPTAEFLENTHEIFFKTFRKLQKTTPVILLSAPDVRFQNEEWIKRRNIINRTYENALNSGDTNVFFVDGKLLWGEDDWRLCSSDCLHPNDIGHYRMAKTLTPIVRKLLEYL